MTPLAGFTVPRTVNRRMVVTTPAAAAVVTTAEVKAHLRITSAAEDAYLATLIPVATEMVERYLSRGLITRSVSMYLDIVPGMGNETMEATGLTSMEIPVRFGYPGAGRSVALMGSPVAAFAGFYYTGMDGVEQTFDPSNYFVDLSDPDMPARVILNFGSVWPASIRQAKALRFAYSVGYGASSASVPATLRHAVLLVTAALWSNRGDNADAQGDVLKLPAIRAALDPFRIITLGVGTA